MSRSAVLAHDVGRFAIVTTRFPGTPVVLRIRSLKSGDCVWGVFKGKEVRVSMVDAWLAEGDAVRLDSFDEADSVAPGQCGVVRDGEWVELTGPEAAAAWFAAQGTP